MWLLVQIVHGEETQKRPRDGENWLSVDRKTGHSGKHTADSVLQKHESIEDTNKYSQLMAPSTKRASRAFAGDFFVAFYPTFFYFYRC